ncbi:putative nucleotidyltransferase, Ribonuclease H [Helianthus annuus]|nr:putative nucleotidyltransferase, Ribonuclease H [Helianthus annuus]
MQEGHPIAFISKALSIKQQSLSVYEKELLAILMAVKTWHHYLITKKFLIKTDQKSLKYLLDQKITTPLQQTWLAKLMGYEYEIFYKKGAENVVADGLSRVQGLVLSELGMSSVNPLLLDRIKGTWQTDEKLQDIIKQIDQGKVIPHVTWDGQLLKRKNKLWVGNDVQLQNDIIQLFHSSPIGGHSGYYPTLQKIKAFFIIGRDAISRCFNRSKNVLNASRPSMNQWLALAICNHCQFQHMFLQMCLWILCLDFLKFREKIQFSWWWTT